LVGRGGCHHLTQGLLWGIFGALTFAVHSLLSCSYVQRYPTLTVSFYQQAFACVCALPFALQWEGEVPLLDVAFLVVLGVVFTGFAQGLAVASLRHLRVQTVGVAYGLEPVYGILFAYLLLNEHTSTRTLCSGAIIVAAVIAASWKTDDSMVDEQRVANESR
jgi:drug/metabolite transporter (DMT)-like permease